MTVKMSDMMSAFSYPEVIRDKKTGESLQYAFIEFDKQEDVSTQASGQTRMNADGLSVPGGDGMPLIPDLFGSLLMLLHTGLFQDAKYTHRRPTNLGRFVGPDSSSIQST